MDVSVYVLETDTESWLTWPWLSSRIALALFASCWVVTLQFPEDKAAKNSKFKGSNKKSEWKKKEIKISSVKMELLLCDLENFYNFSVSHFPYS